MLTCYVGANGGSAAVNVFKRQLNRPPREVLYEGIGFEQATVKTKQVVGGSAYGFKANRAIGVVATT